MTKPYGGGVDETPTNPQTFQRQGQRPQSDSASVSLALSSVPQATLSPLSLKSGYEEWVQLQILISYRPRRVLAET